MARHTKPSKHDQLAPIVNVILAKPIKAEVARRAHEIFVARGGSHGCDLDDWLQAERELKAKANGAMTKR